MGKTSPVLRALQYLVILKRELSKNKVHSFCPHSWLGVLSIDRKNTIARTNIKKISFCKKLKELHYWQSEFENSLWNSKNFEHWAATSHNCKIWARGFWPMAT